MKSLRLFSTPCRTLALVAFASFPVLQNVGIADDWLRFRGPAGQGVSESELPVSWTPDGNVAWKSALPGAGVSSPIVIGDKVVVTCYSGYGLDRQEPGEIKDLVRHVVCFDVKSGDKLWQQDVPTVEGEDPYTGIGVTAHGYASHTPVSDGERIYAFFGKCGVRAYDLDGNEQWKTSVGQESDPWKWGSSASPVVYGDTVIVPAAAESQAIVGLDRMTGKEVWRQEAAGLDGMWSTPTLQKIGDRTDLVLSVAKEIWGLDPSNGKLRWFANASNADQTHSSPAIDGETIFAFSGRGGGSVAVKGGGSGDVSATNVAWQGRTSDRFCSPVFYDGKLYLVASGVLTSIDPATGEELAKVRLSGGGSRGGGGFGGADYPSPIVAGGRLYALNGSGETFVFDVDGELQQVSMNLLTTDAETFGGTPAVANGKLFIRSNKHLYCVADTGKDVAPNASSALIARTSPDDQPQGRGGAGAPGGGRGGFGGGRGGGGAPGGRGGAPGGRGGFGGGAGGRGPGGQADNRPQRPQRPEIDN